MTKKLKFQEPEETELVLQSRGKIESFSAASTDLVIKGTFQGVEELKFGPVITIALASGDLVKYGASYKTLEDLVTSPPPNGTPIRIEHVGMVEGTEGHDYRKINVYLPKTYKPVKPRQEPVT